MSANPRLIEPTLDGIRPRFGRVLVQVEREFNDRIKVGDVTLQLDTNYQPLHHVQEFGTVVAVPVDMPSWVVSPCEVAVGDLVRFHFHSICDHNLVELEGRRYWAVPYEQLYYVARPDGGATMLNDYCLVQPVFTQGGDERTAAGLITNLVATGAKRPVANRGILRHPPRASFDGHRVAQGAEIYYHNDADLPVKVGEETLYVMDYGRDIPASL